MYDLFYKGFHTNSENPPFLFYKVRDNVSFSTKTVLIKFSLDGNNVSMSRQ
jgi:hypothetical protein